MTTTIQKPYRDNVLALLTVFMQRASAAPFDDATPLLEAGLLDSQALLDLILEVENASGCVFDPERVDFADGLTLHRLASAFVPAQ